MIVWNELVTYQTENENEHENKQSNFFHCVCIHRALEMHNDASMKKVKSEGALSETTTRTHKVN